MKIPFLSGLKVNGKVELNNLSLLSTPAKILTIDENNNITYSTSVGGTIDLSNYYNKPQTDTNIANAISALVDSAPSTLDTLNELAAALGDDPNFATTITTLIGTKANASDVYSKSVSDGRYKAIAWLPSWSDIQSRPTALSQLTNDLGNYGNWITQTQGNGWYQPLENQRLSISNNVVFNQITANSKLNIPSTSSNKYSLFVDENGGVGGTGSTIPIISYLNDLSDVTIASPAVNQTLVYNGSQWVNSTIASGTFNYNDLYNKPTSLSQFTNDLNLGSNFHPLENQRLSTNNYPTFSGIRLDASSVYKDFIFQNNGVNRWNFYTENAETGSNTGSVLHLASYLDNGNYNTNIFRIQRATGVLDFTHRPTVGGEAIVINDGGSYNINAANSTLWRGFAYGGSSMATGLAQFVGYDNAGNINFYTAGAAQSALNINNGATLSNNITGNAGSVTNGIYSNVNYSNPAWLSSLAYSKITGAPTSLSQFTNDLGLGSVYQPLENQRLSISNNVVFNQITANSKLNIPSTSTNKYSIFVDENGTGGSGGTIPVITYLNDLSDVIIASPTVNQTLVYNGSQWVNSTITSGTFNYNDLINKPDLSIYALTNGSNASGSWGINISGYAYGWGNLSSNFSATLGSGIEYFLGGAGSEAYKFSPNAIKSVLGVGNGSTLVNNISGIAANSTLWNGKGLLDDNALDTGYSSVIGGIYVKINGNNNVYPMTAAGIREYLALPTSGVYDLQWVTNNGGNTTNVIQINNNVPLLFGDASNIAKWSLRNFESGVDRLRIDSLLVENIINIYQNGDVLISGPVIANRFVATGIITAGQGQGFQNANYQSGRNRIWSFATADAYGLSYYQGAGSIYGRDGIGIHFGNTDTPQFTFLNDGVFGATGQVTAPSIKATSKLEIPAKNTSGTPTGNHFSIWVEV